MTCAQSGDGIAATSTSPHPLLNILLCVCVCVQGRSDGFGGRTAKILVGPYCNCLAIVFSMYLVHKTFHKIKKTLSIYCDFIMAKLIIFLFWALSFSIYYITNRFNHRRYM